ncbi:hypothetical protein BG015_008446 [Linnemannia schmuckeri]|uniref:Chorismate mutase n=1 Tax=Linnemannia schmuckeri TaxID=64567 RepID=A0A9P5VAA3_9FUNG|nr:hypothetical protein BG015_008446 [Linnemannia schmuckeri]
MTRFTSFMTIFALVIASVAFTSAAPVPPQTGTPILLTIDELKAAANGTCPPQTSGELISCEDALPYINDAINKYNLVTRGQRAAYIATMLFESGNLKYNHNLVHANQGTRSMLPQVSLEKFVSANADIQTLVATYPADTLLVDILINNHLDFSPGAWWTVSGPNCPNRAAALDGTINSFLQWEIDCINGGVETLVERAAVFGVVYQSIH